MSANTTAGCAHGMPFDERIAALWENSNSVNLNSPFLYLISITDGDGYEYRYVGKARGVSRLQEYRNNMLKIRAGKERGATQGYRAVHFALFSALTNGWHFVFKPLENCTEEMVDQLERRRIEELVCNLNAAKTWRLSRIQELSLKDLLPEHRT